MCPAGNATLAYCWLNINVMDLEILHISRHLYEDISSFTHSFGLLLVVSDPQHTYAKLCGKFFNATLNTKLGIYIER